MPAQPKPAKGTARRERQGRHRGAADRARDEVWDRDRNRSRASGVLVERGHDDPDRRGECAHLQARSTAPRLKFDRRNQVLLTATEHRDSDPRTAGAGGRRLLEIEGDNADQALTFIRRDRDGREISRLTSWPPAQEQR